MLGRDRVGELAGIRNIHWHDSFDDVPEGSTDAEKELLSPIYFVVEFFSHNSRIYVEI